MRRYRFTAGIILGALAMVGTAAGAVVLSGNINLTPGTSRYVSGCSYPALSLKDTSPLPKVHCAATTTTSSTTTTTEPATTTTTTQPTTTTTTQPVTGGNCTDPTFTSSDPHGTENTDPGAVENWWVNNDAWSGSHGPQTINVCSNTSWFATSNQPNDGGQVETYPDTEYDVGGRQHQSTTPISGFASITSTFAESNPSAGGWDAGYDLWTDNWAHETMIWNQWAGGQGFWPSQANGPNGFALTLDGVPYHFYANGTELMFFRDAQVSSGSVDVLAAWQWEVDHGFAQASDIPTQIEYGTEVAYTDGTEQFNTTGFGVDLVAK